MKKFQQIFSILLVILLVGLYIATIISAIFATEASHTLFLFSCVMTFLIPFIMYVLLMFSKMYRNSVNDAINKQAEDEE